MLRTTDVVTRAACGHPDYLQSEDDRCLVCAALPRDELVEEVDERSR